MQKVYSHHGGKQKVPMTQQSLTIWTIGHGNRATCELMQMLKEAGVECLVDVRSYPGSRKHPHFARAGLESALPVQDLKYVWDGVALGGFRKPKSDSRHVGLRSDGFRGYADYMESTAFQSGIRALILRAQKSRTAIMCAERLPWRCHRSLISDYLVTQGVTVIHLIAPGKTQSHKLNPVANVSDGGLVYDQIAQMRFEV